MRKFLVTEAHGRVFKQVDANTRVLVAIPGMEIDFELADELGLVDQPKPTPPAAKAVPVDKPKFASYPPKGKRV